MGGAPMMHLLLMIKGIYLLYENWDIPNRLENWTPLGYRSKQKTFFNDVGLLIIAHGFCILFKILNFFTTEQSYVLFK
jgi:hypothetical protein